MIDTTPLRKKLLDLAVNGKLVKKRGEWKTIRVEDLGDFCGGPTPGMKGDQTGHSGRENVV